MSEENKEKPSGQTQEPSQTQETKKEYVSAKAYEEVTRDMHKFKERAKQTDAELNELRAQLKAQEEQKLQEQERWKELYERSQAEIQEAQRTANEKHQAYMRSVKISALKQEIGVAVKDEYLQFANLDAIVVNENGSIEKESLREVANSFKQEHGQLIPQSENVNITGQAANSERVSQPDGTVGKSAAELVKHYQEQFKKH